MLLAELLAKGGVAMAYEHEAEMEFELANENENELGAFETETENEQFLGGIIQGISSLLGETETENEFGELGELGELGEFGELGELGEYEQEQFFGGLIRRVGGFVKRAAPMLKNVARIAAPLVAKAVGGPFGGLIGQAAGTLLRENEQEAFGEYEAEAESSLEAEAEAEFGEIGELGEYEVGEASQESAEQLAAMAAMSQNEYESEAMAGGAAVGAISASDRAALRRILPHLVRGVAILTRVLRRRRITRPAVRAVPTVVRRTVKTLRRRVAAGQPVNRRVAGRVMAVQTRRVLGNPRVCGAAIVRNVQATRGAARPARARAKAA
jgi:hypothetical protein